MRSELGKLTTDDTDGTDMGMYYTMKHFFHLLKKLIYERQQYVFYSYDPRQGAGLVDPRVKVYDSWSEIPVHFQKIAAPSPLMNAMYYRLKRGEARLLCYSKDGQELDAYGWIQAWTPFRRKFYAIAQNGTMLGPYWTAPTARGQGIYGRLLAHSLSLCAKEKPILIYTSPENKASQRGIEKAGFSPLGEWDCQILLRTWSRMRKISG